MSKIFFTCAGTGAGDGPKRSPLVPVTPKEIADSALAAAEAGAAIVHLHVRDLDTGAGSRDDNLYRQVVERIRDRNRDVIINLTAGMGGDVVFGADDPLPLQDGTDLIGPAARLSHVEKLRPDLCTLDCGSYNVGHGNLVYFSMSDYIRVGAEQIRQLGFADAKPIRSSEVACHRSERNTGNGTGITWHQRKRDPSRFSHRTSHGCGFDGKGRGQ